MNYQKAYNQLIESARTKTMTSYSERHHIIPRCLGGNNTKSNLVLLSAREHFVAHWLLTKIYPNHPGVNLSLHAMKASSRFHERYETKVTSKVFARVKDRLYGENGLMKNSPHYGKKHTELSKKKMSTIRSKYLQEHPEEMERVRNLSINRTPEHAAKIKAANIGQKRTDEAKRNISLAHIGKNKYGASASSKKVVVKGKIYDSVTLAHLDNKELKLPTLYYRINSKNFSDYYYPDER